MTVSDPTLDEQLSRFLDDDLAPQERRELEERLSTDPELSARLESLRRLQLAIGALAERDQPPAALDRLVAPRSLEQTARTTRRRWLHALAAAATVVIAVGIGLQIAKRGGLGDHHDTAGQPRRATAPTPFPLAPLPEGTDNGELGPSARLIQTPPDQPQLDDPPALEPGGPYDAPPTAEQREPVATRDGPEKAREAPPPQELQGHATSLEIIDGRTTDARGTPAKEGASQRAEPKSGSVSRLRYAEEEMMQDAPIATMKASRATQQQLIRIPSVELLFTEGGAGYTVPIDIALTMAPGEPVEIYGLHPVEVTVDADGTIMSAEPVSEPSASLAAILDALKGQRLEALTLPTGSHEARVKIHAQTSPPPELATTPP